MQDGDKIGELRFRGNTGAGYVNGAVVQAIVNGTPGSGNDLPTDLVFRLQPDGSGNTLEAARFTSTANLLVGTTTVEDFDGGRNHRIQVRGDTYQTAGISILDTQNDDNACELLLGKSRGTGNVIVGDADDVGQIRWAANDGNGFHSIAWIRASMDGNVGSDDLPSNLRFGTCTDGGTTVSERLRITNGGYVNIGGNYTQTTYTTQVTGTFNATGNITQNGTALATSGKAIAMAMVFG